MLIFQFIESAYKCPVYDDSNLFLVLDSSVFIVNVTDKSLIMLNVLLSSEAGFTKGGSISWFGGLIIAHHCTAEPRGVVYCACA